MFPGVLSCDSSTLVKMLQTKPQTQFLRSGKLRVEGLRNNLPRPLLRFDHTSFLHFLFSCNSCFFLSTTVFPFDVFPHISSFFDFLQCFLQKSIVSLAFNPLIITITPVLLRCNFSGSNLPSCAASSTSSSWRRLTWRTR